jgi:hypothetical protein
VRGAGGECEDGVREAGGASEDIRGRKGKEQGRTKKVRGEGNNESDGWEGMRTEHGPST